MELKIVDFIKTHSNWEELLTSSPYNLTIKRDGKLILFKYNQINSDFNEKICREARGLILEEGTWKVVRFAFEKFFNLGENFAAKIDWSSAVGSEKLDGSIISVFFYDGKWRIATNSTINAFKAKLAGVDPYKTFGDLFESVLPLSTFANYNKHRCWTFELVSPYNRVVIGYPETKVYLLSIRDMDSLEELGLDAVEMLADANGLAVPERYDFNNEADYRKVVEQMPEGHEGIVVRDANDERVKIKTLLYFEMHKAKNNSINFEKALDIILANEQSEFLSYFPNYKPFFEMVISTYDEASEEITKIADTVRNWIIDHPVASRRSFAEWVNQSDFGKYKPTAFAIYDGKFYRDLKECKTAKDFMKLYRIGDNIYETMEKNSREEI